MSSKMYELMFGPEENNEVEPYDFTQDWPYDEFGNVDGWELFKQDELASGK